MRGAIFRLVVVAALILIPFFIYQEVANATQRCNDGTFSNTGQVLVMVVLISLGEM